METVTLAALIAAAVLVAAGLVTITVLYTRAGDILRSRAPTRRRSEAGLPRLPWQRRDRTRELEEALKLEYELLQEERDRYAEELERISGVDTDQARQLLTRELEDRVRQDSGKMVLAIEEEARRDADRRARSILSVAMGRVASSHVAQNTVSVVQLENDELKGRIIGREGRNIRALENVTGVDIIVDDTPHAVVLSSFDGVRRELARMTLESLLADGRIHPASIEETYRHARVELDQEMFRAGEQAAVEANTPGLNPELIKLLGRLKYRTSYSQNVLAHSVECARLAGLIATELGASAKTARRGALLHDLGKGVAGEMEGPHALVGAELARRYGEDEAVVHAIAAHHNEVEMQTVEAAIVQIADSVSGSRPGARGEQLELYVKRLEALEEIAMSRPGVDRVFALQAGRQLRVLVEPTQVDDGTAVLLAQEIARDIEQKLEYPGQIKVTVIRESRATEIAK